MSTTTPQVERPLAGLAHAIIEQTSVILASIEYLRDTTTRSSATSEQIQAWVDLEQAGYKTVDLIRELERQVRQKKLDQVSSV